MPTDLASRPTVRAARWSASHPWRAVAMWLVFVAACIAVGNVVGLHEQGNLDNTLGQSGRAAHWMHDANLDSPDTENVLITAREGTLDAGDARHAAAAIASRMSRLDAVTHVSPPLTAKDRSAVTVEMTLRKDADVKPLLAATKTVQTAFPALRVEEIGSTSLNDAVNNQVAADLSAAATF